MLNSFEPEDGDFQKLAERLVNSSSALRNVRLPAESGASYKNMSADAAGGAERRAPWHKNPQGDPRGKDPDGVSSDGRKTRSVKRQTGPKGAASGASRARNAARRSGGKKREPDALSDMLAQTSSAKRRERAPTQGRTAGSAADPRHQPGNKQAVKKAVRIVLKIMFLTTLALVLAFKTVDYGIYEGHSDLLLSLAYAAGGTGYLFLALTALYQILLLLLFRGSISERGR